MQRTLATCREFLAELDLEEPADKVETLLKAARNGGGEPLSGIVGSVGPILVAIAHSQAVNYASAHTHSRILERVVLEIRGEKTRSILVTAGVTSGNLAVSALAFGPPGAPSGGVNTPSDLEVVLDPAAFSTIDSRRPGTLTVRVAEHGRQETTKNPCVRLMPRISPSRHPRPTTVSRRLCVRRGSFRLP